MNHTPSLTFYFIQNNRKTRCFNHRTVDGTCQARSWENRIIENRPGPSSPAQPFPNLRRGLLTALINWDMITCISYPPLTVLCNTIKLMTEKYDRKECTPFQREFWHFLQDEWDWGSCKKSEVHTVQPFYRDVRMMFNRQLWSKVIKLNADLVQKMTTYEHIISKLTELVCLGVNE